MNSQSIANSLKKTSPMGDSVGNGQFNNATATSLTTKYYMLVENLNQVVKELSDHRKAFAEFKESSFDVNDMIATKGEQLKDNVEGSIQKMDGEIQKSLSHQKAENSRLQQQITQLNSDNTIIKNQLKILQKRIEDIEMQIGNYQFK